MVGLLVATVSFTLIVTVAVGLLVAVTVVPAYAAVQMAEGRRFSTTRWFGVAVATILVALVCSYVFHQHDLARIVVVLPLALTWVAPMLLWLLEPGQVKLGGRAGLHE
jgi:multidrug efflux pump subunit AcrB